ncbi:MAG TPA: hypothetical protein VK066_21010 [Chloroflexota bacterium]|nr:hypothetical protein [Chloroflexota bacterium]
MSFPRSITATALGGLLTLSLAVAAGPTAARTQEPPPADCGDDFACFVQAGESCTPTRVVRTIGAEGQGVILMALTRFELRGMQDERCVLYERTEQASLRIDPAVVAQFRAAGVSDEQISQQEDALSQAYSEMAVGVDGTCRLPPDQLASLLQVLNSGADIQFDAYSQYCDGPMFAPQ